MISIENVNAHEKPIKLGFLIPGACKSVEFYFKDIEELGLDPNIPYGQQLHRRFYAKDLKVSAKYMYLFMEKPFEKDFSFEKKRVAVYINGGVLMEGPGRLDEFERTVEVYDLNLGKAAVHYFNDAMWDEMVVIESNN